MKSGFFVSCKKGKELKAFRELQKVLNSLIDNIEQHKEYNTINVSNEIKKEILNLKNNLFLLFFTYKSIVYISNSSPFLPSKLFFALKDKNVKLEYVHRIIPLDRVFTFNEIILRQELKDINKFLTYKIDYEERFTKENTKMNVFQVITKALNGMKVNLTNPDYLIIISVLKNDIGFTILKNVTYNFNFLKNQTHLN